MITYRIHCHAEPTPASLSAALDHVERQLGLHQARGQVRRRRCTFRGDALYLNDNALNGPLPASLMQLRLYEFYYNATQLCEPAAAEFQAWLASIPRLGRTGIFCGGFRTFLPLCLR